VSAEDTPKRTVFELDLERLKRQREASDSRYDEALTRLDAAIYGIPEFPHPPPSPDETQVTPLNTRWDILAAKPAERPGWRGRLARFVWGVLEPVVTAQQSFNATLVDHINRSIHPHRESVNAIETTISVLRQQIELQATFHSTLMQYLQRITPFVNSKDYEFAALARRTSEDVEQNVFSIARTQRALSVAIQGLTDELMRHLESLRSQVQRYDGRIETVNTAMAAVQQQAAALQREITQLASRSPAAASAATSAPASADARGSTLAGDSPTESWKYPAFEAAFRGSEADVTARLARYVDIFASERDVLDVGCGRGEFLDLLREKGVTARGIDLNYEMVELCRARGIEVAHGDVLAHLRSLPEGSLGGLFAAQVVEHLAPDYLLAFLSEAQRVMRPRAPMVLETINVACWYAFFQSYIRDITHAKPLHPDTLKYLVTASGFASAEIEFRMPIHEADRLQPPPEIAWRPTGEDKDAIVTLARTVEQNFEVLNRLMFTYLDYAVIARRA